MKGKLKIYLGYAAGVGKTYKMLKEAQRLHARGIDVKIGYIEPHQRPETVEQLNGLPAIEAMKVVYKNHILYEPNIDEIIHQHPQVVLIDELAHHNPPGSRHEKRWQDIAEILNHGIDVHTTVNIQHIESLYHMIKSITGVIVNERIPDEVIHQSHAIEFIDIEPEELIQRLKEGKIYNQRKVPTALDNFFKIEHLIQLREIALRELAKVQDNKMSVHAIPVHSEQIIAVGITSSPTSHEVIRAGARMAKAFKAELVGIVVENEDSIDSAVLNENLKLLDALGGRYVKLYGDEVEQIGDWCRLNRVDKLVLGRSLKQKWFQDDIITRINKNYQEINVIIISNAITYTDKQKYSLPKFDVQFLELFKLIVILSICTLIALLMFNINLNESNTITVYMLGVLVLALWTESRWMILISSISAVLTFNYFFTVPRFSFEAYRSDYPATFLIMFISGLIISSLAKGVKRQTKIARFKTYRMSLLLETNKQLSEANSALNIVHCVKEQLSRLLTGQIDIYKADEIYASSLDDTLKNHVKWAVKNNTPAGYMTDTFAGLNALIIPVIVSYRYEYVIIIHVTEEDKLQFEEDIIYSIIGDMTSALKRLDLYEEKELQLKEKEQEKTRSTFLKSISHDIRTPLTTIMGNAQLLKESNLDDSNIALSIYEDAKWLNNLVNNILLVTKMEQEDKLNLQLALLEEIIYQAYQLSSKRSGNKSIQLHIENTLMFVEVDEYLITQVIINLIDNALKYTPETAQIEIHAFRIDGKVTIEVRDNGFGVNGVEHDKLFEQFYTNNITSDKSREGLGLGLYICQVILKAHQSSLYVKDNEPQGAIFGFQLQLKEGVL